MVEFSLVFFLFKFLKVKSFFGPDWNHCSSVKIVSLCTFYVQEFLPIFPQYGLIQSYGL